VARTLFRVLATIVPLALTAIAIQPAGPAFAQSANPAARAKLDAMLAPIALYPDTLLTEILMAATYPNEVAAAAHWLKDENNAEYRGDQLISEMEPEEWDPSVKSLVPFPDILKMMAANPDWTRELGAAVTADQAAVMIQVQYLRHRAKVNGKLVTTPQITVQDEGPAIVIAPADPAMIYLPAYNPAVVYGVWPYPAAPPAYFPPAAGFVVSGAGLETGIGFSVGFGVVGPLWGWSHAAWSAGAININPPVYNRINHYGAPFKGLAWRYEPHRIGYFHVPPPAHPEPTMVAKKGHGHDADRHTAQAKDHGKSHGVTLASAHHAAAKSAAVKSASAHGKSAKAVTNTKSAKGAKTAKISKSAKTAKNGKGAKSAKNTKGAKTAKSAAKSSKKKSRG
jgi:hypothetical protein